MTRSKWTIEELAAWGRLGSLSDRLGDLYRPHPSIWPADASGLPDMAATILGALGQERAGVFWSACLASYLLAPDRTPAATVRWLRDGIDLRGLGFSCGWDALTASSWLSLPVPLAAMDGRRLLIVLLGRGIAFSAPWPDWVEEVLDSRAREAVLTAMRLAEVDGAFFWPVSDPAGGRRVSGSSLGLPILLGLRSLRASAQSVPPILATGALESDGGLLPVEHLEQKLLLAAEHGLASFMYPVAGRDPLRECPLGGSIERLPVADLDMAWTLWRHGLPGRGREFMRFLACQESPDWLLRNFRSMATDYPGWLKEKAPAFREALLSETVDCQSLDVFLDQLAEAVELPGPEGEATRHILKAMDWHVAECIGRRNPGQAFVLAQLKLRRSNDTGQTEEGRLWSERSKVFLSWLPFNEDYVPKLLLLSVRSLVADHNRYLFEPTRAREVEGGLSALVGSLLAMFEAGRQAKGQACSVSLGKYYGTLAQHYGFCGGGWLELAAVCAEKSGQTFGDGLIEAHRQDWRRHFGYLAYIHMDAGRFDAAEPCLARYLSLGSLNELEPEFSLDSFGHAALARFLADSGRTVPHYVEASLKQREAMAGEDHPWQLFLYNLGRLARGPEARRGAWLHSLRISLIPGRPTINAMALLPLAALHQERLAAPGMLARETELVLKIIEESGLHRPHFRVVLESGGWADALEAVYRNTVSLFPYTYR